MFHASPRIPGLVKYLAEFGWEAIVVTVPIGEDPEARFGPPNNFKNKYRVVETEGYQTKGDIGEQALTRLNLASKKSYRYLGPLLRIIYYRFYSEVFHYPDKEKRWKHFAIEAGDRLIENEKVDAIISSSSPVTCHIVARELRNKHKIPWVADFRDLWTQNHAYQYSILRKMIEKQLELTTLRDADALVVASSPAAEQLRKLHKREDIYVITNGFDPEWLGEEINLTSKFTITYTGQIYRGRQDPSKLFIALRDLIDDGTIEPEDVEARFYGPEREVLTRGIEKYRLAGIAKEYGVVTRQVAFEKQRESQLVLVFNWEDPWEKGVYTLKIFEYLASGRPILATGGFGDDVIEALVKETKAGVYCRTEEDIKGALKVLYLEYKQNGRVTYTGDMEKINKYSYREMARQFAGLLQQLVPVDSGAISGQ